MSNRQTLAARVRFERNAVVDDVRRVPACHDAFIAQDLEGARHGSLRQSK